MLRFRWGRIKSYRQWEVALKIGRLVLRAEVHGYWQGVGAVLDAWFERKPEFRSGVQLNLYTIFGGIELTMYLPTADEWT